VALQGKPNPFPILPPRVGPTCLGLSSPYSKPGIPLHEPLLWPEVPDVGYLRLESLVRSIVPSDNVAMAIASALVSMSKLMERRLLLGQENGVGEEISGLKPAPSLGKSVWKDRGLLGRYH
jgi:hypothetical protein